MHGSQILTAVLVLLYVLFLAWYDGWWQTTLTRTEVDDYFSNLPDTAEANALRDRLTQFGLNDDGNEFFMLNLNIYQGVDDDGNNDDYSDYSNAVLPMLARRASHPIYYARGLQPLMEPRYEEPWEDVVLVRYRSRRDFISMITSQAYQNIADARTAGIKYAEVFPTGPVINMATPRLFAVLILGAIGMFLHLCLKGRPRYET